MGREGRQLTNKDVRLILTHGWQANKPDPFSPRLARPTRTSLGVKKNWDAISAVVEGFGVAAVLVTLLYLAQQVRQINKQSYVGAFQHMQDQLNNYLQTVSGSEDTAAVVVKGRQAYSNLEDIERLRFEYLQFQLLNIVESHYTQARHTALDDDYRAWVENNLQEIVRGQFSYPGCIEFWSSAGPYFEPEVQALVNRALGKE